MKRYILFTVMTVLIIGGCKKSFLDEEPSDGVPVDQAITTEAEMQAAIVGTYASLRGSGVYGRNIPVFGDLMADNIYVSSQNSGRYLTQNTYNTTVASTEPAAIWTGLYAAIKNANVVINSDIASSSEVDQLRGEALTVRALCHFDLVRYFAKSYSVDPNADGVPLVTAFDQNAKLLRSKVSEVYTQILADLTQAYGLMTILEKNSGNITKYVEKGLESKVHLYMGNWAAARDAALLVVNNSGFSLVEAGDLVGYWGDPALTEADSRTETMFEIAVDAANNNGTNALAYMYDQEGYGDLLATNNLYALYRNGDARKDLFILGERDDKPANIVNKYPNSTNLADKDNLKILRYPEVLMVLAEAYYRLNDEPNARLYLNMLAQEREPGFAGYATTGALLLEDIITERRKELAFEGDRFLDLQRLNRVIDRGPQYPAPVQTIQTDNAKRIQPIPQAERDANPNISQNDGY
jgi:hypothetical protein